MVTSKNLAGILDAEVLGEQFEIVMWIGNLRISHS